MSGQIDNAGVAIITICICFVGILGVSPDTIYNFCKALNLQGKAQRKDKREYKCMEPGGREQGKVNTTFITTRVCCCICVSTGEIREIHAN